MIEGLQSPYQGIYSALAEVREIFHREGRISDSNAKLDETVKFLAIHFAFAQRLIPASQYQPLLRKESFAVDKLNHLFARVARSSPFANAQLGSIFGARPATAFEAGDDAVAFELFRASGYALTAQSAGGNSLDVLNEAFGHHVRDNFRNHIEDAQYMTPPEVVEFMVALAAEELLNSGRNLAPSFTVMDPSCGVGSFLTAWRRTFEFWFRDARNAPTLFGIGQDKVERMVRLSLVNLIFSGEHKDRIFVGNSVADGSPLDQFNGKVDLILTNPPFGAKFPLADIRSKSTHSTPLFARSGLSQKSVDSELLFIDRYLTLLRPGGLCLAVVPDGVVSAKGTPAYLRQQLGRSASLRAIIEMPPVTFAQAGTRTKTAVLMFQKSATPPDRNNRIFFAEADDLGFEVSKRKGVPNKRIEGHNQLPDILDAYRKKHDRERDAIDRPLVAAWREINPTEYEAWTPRQFIKQRKYDKSEQRRFVLKSLGELVEVPKRRKHENYTKDKLFISVLHVIGEGVLDIPGIRSYRPITAGIRVQPGEVIISRLNPRIPRVIVVPDLGRELLCSSEFEALVPKQGVSPYALAYLLLSPMVQHQIRALTAGTSASHSRVKPEKIYEVNVPWPRDAVLAKFDATIKNYQKAMEALLSSIKSISDLRQKEDAALLV
jgi:type I restriction-modification system DNA methylase subunit